MLRTLYPYEKATDNRFHLYAEMLYEFVVGTQISSRYYLDMCEVPVTGFFDEY